MLSAADKIKMALDWVATQEPIAVPTVLTRWSVRSEPDVLKCPTMQTNGRVLQWNPSFVDKLSLSGTKAIVLHEVGHVLSQHQHRRGQRNPKGWNIAADLALNDMLYRGYVAAYNGDVAALHAELIDGPLGGCFAGFARYKDYPRNQDAETYYGLAKAEDDAEKAKQEQARKEQQEQAEKERAERGESDDSGDQDDSDEDDSDDQDDADDKPAKQKNPGKEKADPGDEDGEGDPDEDSEGDDEGDDSQPGEGDEDGEGDDSTDTGSGGDPADFDDDGEGQPGEGEGDPEVGEESGDGVPQGKGKDPFDEDPFANFPDVPGGIEDAPVEATLREDEANATLETLLGGDGYSPLGLGKILSQLRQRVIGNPEDAARINWQRELEKFLRTQHAAGWKYDRPSRRHNHRTDILLPARRARSKTRGLVICDTSGSMSDADCDKAITHMGRILAMFPQSTVTLAHCDTSVRSSKAYRSQDFPIVEFEGWKGRGGTNLNPAFVWAKANRSQFEWLVVITDMEWSWWAAPDPGLPTMWLNTTDSGVVYGDQFGRKLPFGTLLNLHFTR